MKIAGFPIVTHTIQSLNLGKMINGKEDERQLSLLFVDIFVTKMFLLQCYIGVKLAMSDPKKCQIVRKITPLQCDEFWNPLK